MKAVRMLPVSLLLASSLIPAIAQQNQPRSYFVVGLRNIAPEKVQDYLAFMNDAGKKFAQSRIASGEIIGWMHLRLTTPLGPTAGYNYALVSMYGTEPELDRAPGSWEPHAKKAGFASYADYSAKARSFGPVIRQELTRVRLRVGDASPGDYIRLMQYSIAPGQLNDRLAWLEEFAAPISRMRIASGGSQKGYGISVLTLPAGEEAGYDYSVSVVLKDSASVIRGPGPISEADFLKAHPGKSHNAYIQANARWNQTVKLERVRVYKVLDKLGALPQVQGTR